MVMEDYVPGTEFGFVDTVANRTKSLAHKAYIPGEEAYV